MKPHPKPKTTGLYALSPAGGSVAVGATEQIAVRFSPMEIEDASRLLVCDIPDLDAGLQPLKRHVTGKVGGLLTGWRDLGCDAAAPAREVLRRPDHSAPSTTRARPTEPAAFLPPHRRRCCAPGATLSSPSATTSAWGGATPSNQAPAAPSSRWTPPPRWADAKASLGGMMCHQVLSQGNASLESCP